MIRFYQRLGADQAFYGFALGGTLTIFGALPAANVGVRVWKKTTKTWFCLG